METNNGTIAGIDNGKARYYFSLDDHLTEMDYAFHYFETKDDMEAGYSTLYDGLVRKYGEPLNNKNGTINPIITVGFEKAITKTEIAVFDGEYTDYDEWIVDCGDYKVKIDIIGFSGFSTEYYINLGYRMFTDEDVNEYIEEKQKQQDIVDQDL